MKIFKVFFFSWLFIFQQVSASQSLFLDNRGAAVQHYRLYRGYAEALSTTLNNNQPLLRGHPNQTQARSLVNQIDDLVDELGRGRRPGADDLDVLNRIRLALSQLDEMTPEFVEGAIANPVNNHGITDFSLGHFNETSGDVNLERPPYCSNYPNLDRETLRGFYGQVESGEGFTCYELNGNGIGLDLSTMGEALISLEANAFGEQRRELQNSLIIEAVSGILDESVAYAGLYSGTDNNLEGLSRCASTTAIRNSGNNDLRELVQNHRDSLDEKVTAFNLPFGTEENARRDALMRMQVRQALIIGNLYDLSQPESRPDHQSVSVGGGSQESFPTQIVTNCQQQMQEEHGFAFARHDPSGPSRFMVCREPEVLSRYTDEHECVAALQEFLANEVHFSSQRDCYYRESRRLEPVTADRLIPIMSASVDSHPLLFDREDSRSLIPFVSSASNYLPSDFARRVQGLPGADEISQIVEDVLLANPEDPHMAIEERLSQPDMLERLSTLIDQAVANEEMHESLKSEITDYQNELGQSAANVCESDGEHLHQFNSLVHDAIARELEGVSDPQERQRLLARRQAAECWMLEDDPPEYEGGLPTGFVALGVGALALGMVPGIGWAASAALMATGTGVAGTNAYLQFDHSRDRLNATTAAFQGGWTDAQHVLERAQIATDAETALWVEGLSVGILDVASPAARALYRTVRSNENIAGRINAFYRDEAGSVPGPDFQLSRPSQIPAPTLEQPTIYNFSLGDSRLNFSYTTDTVSHIQQHLHPNLRRHIEQTLEEYRGFDLSTLTASQENMRVGQLADELVENTMFRNGRSKRQGTSFFPQGENPQEVLNRALENGVELTGNQSGNGVQNFVYRENGNEYIISRCMEESCVVDGSNVSRGDITSFYPECGPNILNIPKPQILARDIIENQSTGEFQVGVEELLTIRPCRER
ncbi:MAG: hypothetical protein NXH75_02485 [Halobacteriovoraceae bacterium]|nr:hypothetical protein [Halobacteriovoraceae bacterium]